MTGGVVGVEGAGDASVIEHNGAAGGNDKFTIEGGTLHSFIKRDGGGTNLLTIGTAGSNAIIKGDIELTGDSANTFIISGGGTEMDIDITSGNAANGAVLNFTLKNGRVGAAGGGNTIISEGGVDDIFRVKDGTLNSNIVKLNGGDLTFEVTGGTVGRANAGDSTISSDAAGGDDKYTIGGVGPIVFKSNINKTAGGKLDFKMTGTVANTVVGVVGSTIIHNGAGGDDTFNIEGGRLNSSIERDNGGTNTLNIGTALSNAVVAGNISLTGGGDNRFVIDGTNNDGGTVMDINIESGADAGGGNGAVLDFTLKKG